MTSPDPLLGRTLDDRYRIEARLGVGGMGAVYRAWHLRLETWRAIKVMKPELAHDPAFRERFEREARLIEALHHPHLVTLYDLSQTQDGLLYIIYELVEGETLATRLTEGGSLPAPDLALVLGQIADGLAFAHASGVIHRDVSPDNIMVCGTGNAVVAKLLDFGLAKELVPKGTPLTTANLLLGKIGYAAPEQMGSLPKGASLDPRADVFSLSAVLYQALAGRLPWATSSLQAYVHDLLLRPEDELRARIEAEIPPQWRPVVTQGLARDREQRMQGMTALRSAILDAGQTPDRAAPEVAASAGREPQEKPATPTLNRRSGARARATWRTVWISAAALGAVWLGWSALFSSRDTTPPDAARRTTSLTPQAQRPAPAVTVALPATRPDERATPAKSPSASSRAPTRPVLPPATGAPSLAPTRPALAPAASSTPAAATQAAELVVRSAPEAEVRLDGEGRGRTPLRLTLPPGRYQLSLLTQDGRRFDESIALSPGETANRDHLFSEPGSLAISSDPWMNVSVDGGPARQTPTVINRLPAGPHTVRATRPGWRDVVVRVEIVEGRTKALRLTPRRLADTPDPSVQE